MTVDGMQVSPWTAWLIATLACCGLWAVCWQASELVLWVRDRRRNRRESSLPEDCPVCHDTYYDLPGHLESCGCDLWGREPGDEDYGLAPLPPERSREELGFTGEQPAIGIHPTMVSKPGAAFALDLRLPVELGEHRERRASWWEAEHRAAYESLGFDYPSGLIAKVREAGQ